jgi:hypothetical protein
MSIATALNFSPTTPAAPTGKQLIVPQNDGGAPNCNESFYDPTMVGDSGSGGLEGNVPKPAAGDAAAGKFLKADGTWATIPAAHTFIEEVVTFTGTAGTLAHAPAAGTRLDGYRNGVRMTSLAGSPAIQTFSISGTAVTLSVAAGGTDVFIFAYSY